MAVKGQRSVVFVVYDTFQTRESSLGIIDIPDRGTFTGNGVMLYSLHLFNVQDFEAFLDARLFALPDITDVYFVTDSKVVSDWLESMPQNKLAMLEATHRVKFSTSDKRKVVHSPIPEDVDLDTVKDLKYTPDLDWEEDEYD